MDTGTLQQLRREYVENRIRSAQPVEIVAMLFEIAIESVKTAIADLKTNDRFARSRAVTRAEQAIHELVISLDHSVDPSFSRTSAGLYRYALDRVVAGHASESEQEFQEALAVLQPLGSAWTDLTTRLYSEPSTQDTDPEQTAEPAPNDPYGAYRQNTATVGSRDWSL